MFIVSRRYRRYVWHSAEPKITRLGEEPVPMFWFYALFTAEFLWSIGKRRLVFSSSIPRNFENISGIEAYIREKS